METHRHTNELIHETSPYLLQHAHNPVNWMPWGEEALQQAKAENKLLLISIGYAACHWCHVMEHESFEDELVAEIMNRNFVCIKVDREERPDVDQIYMTAVQLMTERGGWPLNAVALPDGRPIWGGTYFPKESWVNALQQLAGYHRQHPDKTTEYAQRLMHGIEQSVLLPISRENRKPGLEEIKMVVRSWQTDFDWEEGGSQGAPKFMMPGNLLFLLRWAHQQEDGRVEAFVETTLNKMAMGGIYDQLGGGFARYSTDTVWRVPHFEKMLYDNGQLLSLYSRAFQKFQYPLYRELVGETIGWLKREMLSPENGFYSSLDADSEGEEGKFYVWQKADLQKLLCKDSDLFAAYFNVNSTGYWEDGNYILLRRKSDAAFAEQHDLSLNQLKDKVKQWKTKLLAVREEREHPALDDKILTSWNALVITGLTDAYKALGEPEYLELATKNADFVTKKLMSESGTLHHSYKNGSSKVDGFLEDYALFIQALVALFEVTADAAFLQRAEQLTETTFKQFFDPGKGIFYFSPAGKTDLITRSVEVYDNVIPSSNSVMANNLFQLGHLLGKPGYLEVAEKMLEKVGESAAQFPSGHSNWLNLALSFSDDQFEVAITGPEAIRFGRELQTNYMPNCLFCMGETENLPLLKNRVNKGKTQIYVCQNQACQLPVETPGQALKLICGK
ncbi:thioredoxin domain-containing protein [Gaoshiqia sediminis]|uniref:Thioredoxin domain-containing protein n=1 Tax=Gaoshiqia sediminis TaxID=2986998 RepID=A0AA41Y773_9BACT|nr:thioredoxin domain-containing protein [Gaoshiqia sediminis]MCW0484701.1 thioredoxin domain-containing protein [Gaoshiqia sediminis]